MQFDDFDKKIKEAAEHHHPAYDEMAWDKMEKLLDKHLPTEKDDRRRILFLLFLFLLTGAGVYLAISRPWQSKTHLTDKADVSLSKKAPEQSSTATPAKAEENKPVKETAVPETDQSGSLSTDSKTKSNSEPVSDQLKSNDKSTVSKALPEVKNNRSIKYKTSTIAAAKDPVILKDAVEKLHHHSTGAKGNTSISEKDADANKVVAGKINNADIVTTPKQNMTPDNANNVNQGNIIPADKPAIDNTAATNNTPHPTIINADSTSQKKPDAIAKVEDQKKNTETPKKDIQKPGKQKKSALAITLTAAPDLSTVGISRTGKLKLSYGAGFSYTLNRFTLRSGFYVSNKVYTAGPDDYHPAQHSWTYYVDLKKIDADCKIYEIPVSLSYNFSQTKTHNWFASAGLSTYLMKRESYDFYIYNDTTQSIENKTKTFTNARKHFFTILNLSAGYERILNRSLSLIAEPYLNIPLDGIGVGAVKLNSLGVAITLSIKLFPGQK